jgi:hypothetical protein
MRPLPSWTASRPTRIRDLAGLAALAALMSAVAQPGHAAPHVPASDGVVVETLAGGLAPAGDRARLRAERQARRAEHAALLQQPVNLPRALQAARAAIGRARQAGDPRELGQAQAVLAPWWPQVDAPAPVRLLRATIRQSQHDFDAARTELDALRRDPRVPLALRAQAELSHAAVRQVQGQLADARAGCQRLVAPPYAALGRAVTLPAQACLSELASLQGDAPRAERELAALARGADPAQAGWLALVRAELAQRRGSAQAEALFNTALRAQADVYTLAAYSDWLLDQRRPREVLDLLTGREAADALLLRLAIAQQRLGRPEASASIATLQARFDATRARGDSTHRREEARFLLALRGDAAGALRLAQANWSIQREPADARLLAEAADAAGATAVRAALQVDQATQGRTDLADAVTAASRAPSARVL